MIKKENDKPLTKRQKKTIDAATFIRQKPPQSEDMVFTHSILCQVGLPRSKVAGREFMRRSGDAWLVVQAGWLDEGNGPVEQLLPYGAMPRLTMAWLSSYALRNKTREIAIGHSANEFLRLMGMDSQGARHRTLRTQMHALAACRLQLGFKGRTYNGQPVEQFDAWLRNEDTKQLTFWPGVLTLSEGYFKGLIESAVPLDNRALHVLKGSALALDIYAWLAHRLHRIEGRPVLLYWTKLRDQFAQEYNGKNADKDFKRAFMSALKQVLVVYPKAKVEPVKGGLLLYASPPPIPFKS
ncbi:MULTISPECIES: replication protein RepA [Photorhabdus]|uniref:Replication protein n=3 Tax=Photorhabdus TaxID=29487 RepID=A0A7X5QPZ6_9GAMM|nr:MULTISPECIES: replication protein RepA [Photorhabdus]MCW7763382.1 replication protein RepA [Photorhabdus luminescens subsp. venezuelensis]MQL50113.1 replication protein [Photorhabdus khanii]NHB98350.1 replication protein [Photorhabdus stackebrandtii]